MGAIVKYRDLPGGPVDVRFGEEVSRHCLCTQCGMLSMHVYEDRNEHVFCGACIDERRCKNHTHIFCKYEQKNVSLGEMVKAKDVVTAMRDQYAFCPNKGCGSCVHLKALSEHYSGCIARVASTACLQNIETREWESNWQEYSPARHEEPTAMETDQTQWPVDNPSSMMTTAHQVNDADRPGYSYGSPERHQNYANPDAYRPATQGTPNTCDVITRTRSSSPENWKPQAPNSNHRDAREGEAQLTACDYCKRPVKEANLLRHLEVCPKAPTDCVYCGEYFPKEDVTAHFKVCRENPGNVPQSQVAPLTPSLSFAWHQGWPWWLQPAVSTSRCAFRVARAALNLGLVPAVAICRKIKNAVRSRIRVFQRYTLQSRFSMPGERKRPQRRRQWY